MNFNSEETTYKKASIKTIMKYYNLNCILCNDIIKDVEEIEPISNISFEEIPEEDKENIYYNYLGYAAPVNYEDEYIKEEIEQEYNSLYYKEYYQFYIINPFDVDYWHLIGHDIFYHNKLDLYIMAVDHCGTSWDYILTEIPLIYTNEPEKENRHLILDVNYVVENLKSLI